MKPLRKVRVIESQDEQINDIVSIAKNKLENKKITRKEYAIILECHKRLVNQFNS